ncbi:MAG TPA: acyloxyacyl hydrolase [Sphingomicrobium sp.]|nr:acyloxyacyl hydrolase [Sphingomicrobium sp.]
MPKLLTYTVSAAFAALILPSAALAGELFGGLYKHNVDTPLTIGSPEGGVDLQVGYRGEGIGRTGLQPYAFGALNTAGDTSYAAAGLSYKFGDKLFIRPGLGIAIHNGSADDFNRTDRIAFGSRVLFEPELGVGARINQRLTLEASWVHMSHAQLFGQQNPGIDNIGARLTLGL